MPLTFLWPGFPVVRRFDVANATFLADVVIGQIVQLWNRQCRGVGLRGDHRYSSRWQGNGDEIALCTQSQSLIVSVAQASKAGMILLWHQAQEVERQTRYDTELWALISLVILMPGCDARDSCNPLDRGGDHVDIISTYIVHHCSEPGLSKCCLRKDYERGGGMNTRSTRSISGMTNVCETQLPKVPSSLPDTTGVFTSCDVETRPPVC
jgi:hypothetical protein